MESKDMPKIRIPPIIKKGIKLYFIITVIFNKMSSSNFLNNRRVKIQLKITNKRGERKKIPLNILGKKEKK